MGHADSITNDERGSWSDISDWSSSNPVTRVIKVTLPTLAISLYSHPHIHTCIHSIRPCPLDDSGPESPEGSGTMASHMRRNASQRSVLRHEAAVASFKHEQRPTEVRRPAHKGLEAASRQIEPGEKTQMSLERPSPSLPQSRQGHLNLLVRS